MHYSRLQLPLSQEQDVSTTATATTPAACYGRVLGRRCNTVCYVGPLLGVTYLIQMLEVVVSFSFLVWERCQHTTYVVVSVELCNVVLL